MKAVLCLETWFHWRPATPGPSPTFCGCCECGCQRSPGAQSRKYAQSGPLQEDVCQLRPRGDQDRQASGFTDPRWSWLWELRVAKTCGLWWPLPLLPRRVHDLVSLFSRHSCPPFTCPSSGCRPGQGPHGRLLGHVATASTTDVYSPGSDTRSPENCVTPGVSRATLCSLEGPRENLVLPLPAPGGVAAGVPPLVATSLQSWPPWSPGPPRCG